MWLNRLERKRRLILKMLIGIAILYLGFALVVTAMMHQPPERFAAFMARMPMPAMMAIPFPPLWSFARDGALKPGDPAPEFDLQSVDRKSRVRMSSFLGVRPVVLVFGSYT